jgi:2-oxo-4-hydroxy-4-carboxy-5-ureidoimidazoline decarboxylase
MTIQEINSLSREAFVESVGWIFEHSAWVAERAWEQRPFADLNHLHSSMTAEVDRATTEKKLGLLRAHPDLGARARMSAASAGEQSGAGLDRLTPEEFQRLQQLNNDYRQKLGFPFLYAVRGSTKYDILQALERRLGADPAAEFQEALQQVYRIAMFRLQETFNAEEQR